MSIARPTRRTLVRGAAWSVPVVAIAATAPAFAASSVARAVAGPGPAVKWGGGKDGIWHISWDVTLTTAGKVVSSATVTFTYVPTSGRAFENLAVYGFNPSDSGWVPGAISSPSAGVYSITATHAAPLLASSNYSVHADFFGTQNNSAGTVEALATFYYADGTQSTAAIPQVSWSAGDPHTGH